MVDSVYQKTEAGQEEIRTRSRKLDHKLRALLLIVNGERRKSELLAQVGGMGVGEEALDTLLALGLVVSHAAPPPAAEAPAPRQTQSPRQGTNLFTAYSSLSKGIDDVLADTAIAPNALIPAGADGYKQLYHFYTDVIGNHLGLRGYVLQVKVEKAGTVAELAELRDTLAVALQKAKGEITARAIMEQLDALLAGVRTS